MTLKCRVHYSDHGFLPTRKPMPQVILRHTFLLHHAFKCPRLMHYEIYFAHNESKIKPFLLHQECDAHGSTPADALLAMDLPRRKMIKTWCLRSFRIFTNTLKVACNVSKILPDTSRIIPCINPSDSAKCASFARTKWTNLGSK